MATPIDQSPRGIPAEYFHSEDTYDASSATASSGHTQASPSVKIEALQCHHDVVRQIATKWFEVGLQLHIDENELLMIRQYNSKSGEAAAMDMLRLWIKTTDNPATADALCQALSKIRLSVLAGHIKDELVQNPRYLSELPPQAESHIPHPENTVTHIQKIHTTEEKIRTEQAKCYEPEHDIKNPEHDIKIKVIELDAQLQELDVQLQEFDAQLQELDAQFQELGTQLQTLKIQLGAVLKNQNENVYSKAKLKEFVTKIDTVTKTRLESALTALDLRLQLEVDDIKSGLVRLKCNFETQLKESEIKLLQLELDLYETKKEVSDNKSQLKTKDAKISGLKTQLELLSLTTDPQPESDASNNEFPRLLAEPSSGNSRPELADMLNQTEDIPSDYGNKSRQKWGWSRV